ncbi:MAG: hypothetical protein NT166_17475 [Candidatus Aminicenantes bacterium]|nr:hypothetical protein [Candidatus Aminicenantes bacterium]
MIKQTGLKFVSRILLAVFVLFLVQVNVFALIYGNESQKGFGNPGGKSSGPTIKTYVLQGAGYFLNSYSDILLFLNKIELAELNGVDYIELQNIVTRAGENIQQQKDAYLNLTQLADATPYDPAVIDQLSSFDYAAFQREKALNSVIFADVQSYLSKGDIRGVYHRFLAVAETLQAQLNTIKTDIDAGRYPQPSALWNLDQISAQSLLFGQYTAEVFYRVMNIGVTGNDGI